MGSVRRNAAAPGLAGLSDADRDAWVRGDLTQADIGMRLGVSKQAIAREFRRRGWTKPAPPLGKRAKRPQTTLPDSGRPSQPDATFDALSSLVEYNLNRSELLLLEITARELERVHADPTRIVGASALKAAAATLTALRASLGAAGFLKTAASQPVELKVGVYTPEQETAIREEAERTSRDLAASVDNAPTPQPKAEHVSESGHQDSPRGPQDSHKYISDPLPTPEGYRAWLGSLAARKGLRVLREIVRAIEGGELPSDREVHSLIDRIVRITDGDPGRLQAFCV